MKNKILFGISLILLFCIIFFSQVYIIDGRTLFGIKPNVILISFIVFTCFSGIYKGVFYSFFVGIMADMIYGSSYGMYTTCYVMVAIVIGLIEKNYRKESKTSLILITFIGTAVFEAGQFVIYSILLYKIINVFFLIKQVFIASIFNMAIVYILNGIVQKVAEYFEIKAKERDAL